MRAVMYHYIRFEDDEFPEFKFLHFNDFCKQLDYFQEQFAILHPNAIIEAQQTLKVPPKGIVLTFDDGLNDHYKWVVPELKKRNLSAIFYLSSAVYEKNKMLDVHRIHLLLGKFGGKIIFGQLITLINDEMLTDAHVEEFKTLTYLTQANDTYTEYVKRILNYLIGYDFREKVLDTLMKHFFPEEKDILNNFYLTTSQIKEMHDDGFIIGSHSVSHSIMSKLSEAEQDAEVVDSFAYLNQITGGLNTKTFCYPYGGFYVFTKYTEELLTKNGCQYSFNVEPRDIALHDLINRPQALPRYDCNFFQNGTIWQK